MYSFPYLEPICSSRSNSNCCFLTHFSVAGRWSSIPNSLRNFHGLLWSTTKVLAVNKAEIDVFLELSRFFNDPTDVGNLISGSSAFSKSSLDIWKLTVHVLLKTGLGNFEHYFSRMWVEWNCVVVWPFFGIVFLWNWSENGLFQSCGHCWVFQIAGILSAALSQHHHLGLEIAQLEFHHPQWICI